MNTRSPILRMALPSLITLLLIAGFFVSASPTLASQIQQVGDQDSPELADPDGVSMDGTPVPEDFSAAGSQYLHIAGSAFVPLY